METGNQDPGVRQPARLQTEEQGVAAVSSEAPDQAASGDQTGDKAGDQTGNQAAGDQTSGGLISSGGQPAKQQQGASDQLTGKDCQQADIPKSQGKKDKTSKNKQKSLLSMMKLKRQPQSSDEEAEGKKMKKDRDSSEDMEDT